jgi:hypothetical protein
MEIIATQIKLPITSFPAKQQLIFTGFQVLDGQGELVFIQLPSGHRRFHPDDIDAYMRRYEVYDGVSAEVKVAADEIVKCVYLETSVVQLRGV